MRKGRKQEEGIKMKGGGERQFIKKASFSPAPLSLLLPLSPPILELGTVEFWYNNVCFFFLSNYKIFLKQDLGTSASRCCRQNILELRLGCRCVECVCVLSKFHCSTFVPRFQGAHSLCPCGCCRKEEGAGEGEGEGEGMNNLSSHPFLPPQKEWGEEEEQFLLLLRLFLSCVRKWCK